MPILSEIKRFKELSTSEWYDLLQLRSRVFVVEQNCVYQDVDGKDENALHLLGIANGKIEVYSRLFKPGDYFENAAIGRVVISPEFRNKKLGHQLMQNAIAAIEECFGTKEITISAQLYLKNFYETQGFVQVSEEYLEDGIPHIEMLRN